MMDESENPFQIAEQALNERKKSKSGGFQSMSIHFYYYLF
jgi:hypothetical protein